MFLCGSENPPFFLDTHLDLPLVQPVGQLEVRAQPSGVIALGRPFAHSTNLSTIPNQIRVCIHQLLNPILYDSGPDFSVQNKWPSAWRWGESESSLERPNLANSQQARSSPEPVKVGNAN